MIKWLLRNLVFLRGESEMDYNDLEKLLLEFESAELIYKRLYDANPYDKMESVKNWNEFVIQYQKINKKEISIPIDPPSDIEPEFFENQFFLNLDRNIGAEVVPYKQLFYLPHRNTEIVVFKHLRYLPIFQHSLEFIKIIYVLRGNCWFYVNDREIVIPEGGICIVSPNIEQAVFSGDDNNVVINIIMRRSTFENAFSPLLMESNSIADFLWQMLYSKKNPQILLFFCGKNKVIKRLVLDLYQESQFEEVTSMIIMKSYIMLLFGQIIRYHQDNAVSLISSSHKQKKMPLIIRYIKENKNHVTLTELSKKFHLSQGYLSRYIKRETGYTFLELLRELRIKQAAEMLKNSTLSVEEIVEAVGYTDISRFYHNFKKTYGMTPKNYREKQSIFFE